MKRSLRVLYIGKGYKLDGESNESFLNESGSLPHCFGHLQSLRLLHFDDCRELKRLPESFGNLSALKMLKLEYRSLNCLPDSFGQVSRLEDLNLSYSDLESLPPSFSQLSRLRKLDVSGCKRLSRRADGFGQLKSLTHLQMCGCSNLEMVSDDFEQLSSLCAVDASECPGLDGKAMEKLVEMQSLMFLNIRASNMLIRRWREVKAAHPLIVLLDDDLEPSYEGLVSIALFHKDSKFLLNDGDLYFADWSPGEGIKEVGFVLSRCDLCAPSNKAALERLKREIGELVSQGVGEIVYVGMGQSKEGIRQTLLQLPRGTRAFMALDDKTNMLLAYSLYQQLYILLKYQNTVIARARMRVDEKGEKYVSGFKSVTADVEEFKDIAGGFSSFFFHITQMDKYTF